MTDCCTYFPRATLRRANAARTTPRACSECVQLCTLGYYAKNARVLLYTPG